MAGGRAGPFVAGRCLRENIPCTQGDPLRRKTLAAAAIALIDDPALLQKAREEYAGRAGSGYVCPIEPDAVPIAI